MTPCMHMISLVATLISGLHAGVGGTFALYSLLKRQAEMGESSKSMDKSLAQYSISAKQMSQRNSFGRKMSHVAQVHPVCLAVQLQC